MTPTGGGEDSRRPLSISAPAVASPPAEIGPASGTGPDRVGQAVRAVRDRFTAALGGSERRRVILLFTAVLSLQSADSGAVGALAPQLEQSFRIGNTELGLLVTVSSLVGAFASLPVGVLTDRTRRVRLLVAAICFWAVAMVATGLSVDYTMLLISRLGLGAVSAVAGPTVPSLIGDFFAPSERSRVYSFVLTGDVLGAGAGLLVAGDLGALAGWRVAFFLLAIPSVTLAVLLHRLMPEPARDGRSRLSSGDDGMSRDPRRGDGDGRGAELAPSRSSRVKEQARSRHDVRLDDRLVLREDPTRMGAWRAARFILRIPSNRLLILSSALGYFFFAGLRTFAVIFARGRFGISEATVSGLLIVVGAGAVAGTLLGGQLADRLIRRGVTDSRMLLAGSAFVLAVVALGPAFWFASVTVSLPLFVVAAALLSAPNPALDAARLDVVPGRLWGRAESVRTFVRTVLEAFAPLLFGFVSSLMGGGSAGFGGGVNSSRQPVSAGAATGLAETFLIMLVPLMASGLLLLRGRRRYIVDVATAAESDGAAFPGSKKGNRRRC